MTISYAPGSWILIAGRTVNVLLPESEKQRAASVWAAIDSGAGFSEALDAIVSAGLAGLSGFALVANEGDLTRAVVRGDLRVELRTAHDTTVVAGTGTWAEESLSGVRGVSVWAEPAGDQRLILAEGLVRAAGFESGTAIAGPVAAVVPVAVPVAPILSLVPTALPVGLGAAPTDGPPLVEESDAFDDQATDDFGALGIEPEAEPGAAADYGLIPPPPAFPPPGHAPEAVHAPEPISTTPEPVRLTFSHGDDVEVTGPVVVGRAPHPDRFSHLVDPLIVRVPSPHQEISGTHLAIAPTSDGGVHVTDLGSTNGTLIIRGGGAPEELRPGVGVSIARGDVIDLGDGLTIRVV